MLRTLLIITTVAFTASAGAQTQQPVGLKKLEGCEVIARIDNQVVLASDVLWEVNLIIQDNLDKIPPEQIDDTREMLTQKQLRSYIDTKLIYADFRRQAQGADMQSIRQQLNGPFYSGGNSGSSPGSVPGLMKVLEVDNVQDLDRKLVSLGTSLADRKDAFIEKAISQTWIHEQVSVDKPTYEELSAYYEEHLEEYAISKAARWEELAVQFSNHASRDEAHTKLAEAGNIVWQRVEQKPAEPNPLFTDVAAKYSEGFNAKDGGLYDWTTEGALRHKALDAALFSLPVGALSPIIETESGYHIVRVIDRREAGHTPFTELQDTIRDDMMNRAFREQTEELIGKLRRETRIWTIYNGDTTAQAYLESLPAAPRRR